MSELMEWDHASDENPIRQIRRLVERIGDLERRIPTGFFDWTDNSGRGTSGTIMNAPGTFNVPTGYSYYIENAPVALGEVISLIKGLPGLIGFWPMSVLRRESATSQVRDVSGAGYHLTNTGCTFGVDEYMPYARLNGSSYLSLADGGAANWADVLGTEAHIRSGGKGLTFGGWFYMDDDADAAGPYMFSKREGTPNVGYGLSRRSAGNGGHPVFSVTNGAGGTQAIAGQREMTGGKWWYIVCRYTPGTEIAIFQGDTKRAKTDSVVATLMDVATDFIIGARGGPQSYMTGRAGFVFLAHVAIPDDTIRMINRATYNLFRSDV